jgi:hypothetical protein
MCATFYQDSSSKKHFLLFHSLLIAVLSLLRTPLIKSSQELAMHLFYKGPRDVTKQYSQDNLSKVVNGIATVEEDARVVIQAITEELTYQVPTFTRMVTFQTHLISWLNWILPLQAQERLFDYLSVSGGYGPYKEVVETIQTR